MSDKIAIIGAGVSGLTLAYQLAKSGQSVILIEKAKEVGGLARTFRYNGFAFDIGPHRFHTDDQQVLDFIKDVLDHDYQVIDRSSGVYLFDKYFDWPLQFQSVFRLPPLITIKCLKDLFFRKKYDGDSFSAYIKNKYGSTLYQAFFKNYTEKFLFEDCNNIHRDWAEAGINRAVIDKRVKVDNILSVALNTLLPKPVKTEFIYPKTGIDEFNRKLAKKIRDLGGQILTSTYVTDLNITDNKITQLILNSGETIEPDQVLWTGSINSVLKLTGNNNQALKFLALLCYNVEINEVTDNPYQWCYYGGDFIFSRLSIPRNFSEETCPTGKTGVCVEVTCQPGDQRWQNPKALVDRVKRDLIKIGLTKSDLINNVHIAKFSQAYPVYTLDYRQNLDQAQKKLSHIKNLQLFGRTGSFWYNNMDHSIKQALAYCQTGAINQDRQL